ncbi:hypothetical protein Rsub_06436 [Raphidocelis subcapitata]|uniref:Uncharacterized protein n=1 Tax=Raphidocelis subcapitata TaxID=307507 RepID=A0A2V0P0K5_9CHLO|nr:hypothetical protein Rsub_06436 [Raphidocelis subcapitata]|eukprot:GBF93398.1 hypothetical protein Rsub_06436 [Raphidocelis subcapitata]
MPPHSDHQIGRVLSIFINRPLPVAKTESPKAQPPRVCFPQPAFGPGARAPPPQRPAAALLFGARGTGAVYRAFGSLARRRRRRWTDPKRRGRGARARAAHPPRAVLLQCTATFLAWWGCLAPA